MVYMDITNYVQTRAATGIQRVVREILYRLKDDYHRFDYRVIFNNNNDQNFNVIDPEELNDFLQHAESYQFNETGPIISLDSITDGDIFFDLDGVWNNGLKRMFLYKILKSNGVAIFNFIYDLVPVVLPAYSHVNTVRNFTHYLNAVYDFSDFVFFDSRSAEKDFIAIKDRICNDRCIATKVVKLGSDVSSVTRDIPNENSLLEKKFILFVGTLEPRKNQALVLDVFEKLTVQHDDIHLVLVGREGWDNTALINRIKSHPLLNKKIHWPQNVTDNALFAYYEKAYISVYISAHEGFGLPIAESLKHGCITITSKNTSMYEVGKNFADYLDYNTDNELFDLLDLYLSNDVLYQAKKDYIAQDYFSYSWDLTYESVAGVLATVNDHTGIEPQETIQFVVISIDFDSLQGTIAAVDKYIDFVDEYIVVTRKSMLTQFAELDSKNKIVLIDEDDILGGYAEGFSQRDHVSKNWLLRASLLNLYILQNKFIMFDDDNRPLKHIPIEHFISAGKYNAYYFYDLLNWHSFDSDYDFGIHHAKQVLDKDGFELLAYSSHRPQIIDTAIFREVVDKYFEAGLRVPLDEWSVYFNYAISHYPLLFNKLKYDTLNWPGRCSNWRQDYLQDEYNFENYYATNTQGALTEKINAKDIEVQPYLDTAQLADALRRTYKDYNMVHGVLSYPYGNKAVYVLNVPYLIQAKTRSWVKLALNYKALLCQGCDVSLVYYINKQEGSATALYIPNEFADELAWFAISCEYLKPGSYELLLDVCIDGKAVYGMESPYMIKLMVVE